MTTNDSDKIILAIDPGTSNLGWCLAQGEDYICSGVQEFDGANAFQRMPDLVAWCKDMFECHDPDIVALEEPRGDHGNMDTNIKIAGAFWAPYILALTGGCCCEVVSFNPVTVKATDFHKHAIPMVAALIGKSVDDVTEDEADAVGIWQATVGWLRTRRLYELARAQSKEEVQG